MAPAASLLGLPTELQMQIIDKLDFPEVILLKMTCRHFNRTIEELTHEQLHCAEETELAKRLKLFGCCNCGRLRHESEFHESFLPCGPKDTSFCEDCVEEARTANYPEMMDMVTHTYCTERPSPKTSNWFVDNGEDEPYIGRRIMTEPIIAERFDTMLRENGKLVEHIKIAIISSTGWAADDEDEMEEAVDNALRAMYERTK